MRLKHVETLHALMTAGTVTGAAKLLHVSPPAVSKALAHAEMQLGYPLFTRQQGKLIPTSEALVLHGEAQKIPQQLQALKTLAEELRSGGQTNLRVAALPAIAQHLMPRVAALLSQTASSVRLEVRVRHTAEQVSTLLLRQADWGLDFDFTHHPSFQRTQLLQTEMVCLAPEGWFDMRSDLPAALFKKQAHVGYYHGDPMGARLGPYGSASEQGGLRPPAVWVDTYAAAAEMAVEGIAAAIVDPFTALRQQSPKTRIHRLRRRIPLTISMFRLNQRPTSVADQALMDAVSCAANDILNSLFRPTGPM